MSNPLSSIEYAGKPLSDCSREDLLSLVVELLEINADLSSRNDALQHGYCSGYRRRPAPAPSPSSEGG